MNREIKFRVWAENTEFPKGKMYVDNFLLNFNGDLIFPEKKVENNYSMTWARISFNNIVLMQFTGLTDKNGKEIYEGDVIETKSFLTKIIDGSRVPNSEHENMYVVEWNSDKKVNTWQIRCVKTTRHQNFGLGNTSDSFLYTYTDKCEIIGNIYENPELL